MTFGWGGGQTVQGCARCHKRLGPLGPLVPRKDYTEELCCSDSVLVVYTSVPLFSSGRVVHSDKSQVTTARDFKKSSPRIRFLIRLWKKRGVGCAAAGDACDGLLFRFSKRRRNSSKALRLPRDSFRRWRKTIREFPARKTQIVRRMRQA